MITVINPAEIKTGSAQLITADLTKFDIAKANVSLVVAELEKFNNITAADQIEAAMECLKTAAGISKAIEERRVELVKPFNDGATKINAYKKELVKDMDAGITRVKSAILTFQQEQKKVEQALLAAARKIQLEQMGFSFSQAGSRYERAGIGTVYNREIDSYDPASWDAMIQGLTEQIQTASQKEAKQLAANKELIDVFGSDEDKADTVKVLGQVAAPAPVVQFNGFSAPVKGTTRTWTFEILNQIDIPREYLIVDETAIRAAIKAGTRSIPGVKIFQKESLAIR